MLRLTHFAEVTGIYQVHDVVGALRLAPFHVWSQETVQARFAYRTPGLHALLVRVYRAAEAIQLPDTAAYAGCRSWVELGRALPTEPAAPVLNEADFAELRRRIDRLLNPIGLA